jgi:hypothetical protein
MAFDEGRRLVHFEVHVRRGERWTIELAAPEQDAACERARQFLQRPAVEGVKVWKEVYDPGTDQSAGRIVFAETKPKRKGRWRFGCWTAAVVEPAALEPSEAYVRRNVAPPPIAQADWPLAVLSIGGGCAALVALAALAALGDWAPLR